MVNLIRWLSLIVILSLFSISCSDPDPINVRTAKIYFKDGGNSPCQYNPYASGNIQFSSAVLDKDGDVILEESASNQNLLYDETGGYYLEMSVPQSGNFGLEFYVFGQCSSCCSVAGSGSGRPIFHAIKSGLSQTNYKYLVNLKFLKCTSCF